MHVREWSRGGLSAELVSAGAGVTLVGHSHAAPHVILVLEGRFADDGRPYGTGDMRVSPAGDRHFVRFFTPATCLLVAASDAVSLPAVRERQSGSVPLARRPPLSRLLPLVSRPDARPTGAVWEELVSELLSAINGQRERLEAPETPPWLRELRARVASGPERAWSVALAARRAGVSREHLARSFRRHFGTSFVTYRRHQRVAAASRCLATTPSPLADIALACGFSDQSHMTRAFAECLGRTPGSWRSAVAGGDRSQTFKPAPSRVARLDA